MDKPKAPNGFIQSYKKTQVNTASPEQLLLLMYEGLIRFMGQAKDAAVANDHKQKIHFVDRARKIIAELRRTLRHDVDIEVSGSLERLYDYLNLRLLQFLVDKDTKAIEECLELTASLHDSWKVAIDNIKNQQSAEK